MLLAVYGEQFGRLLSVEWSAVDADIVFTGCDDHTVHGWRVSQHRWDDGELSTVVASATEYVGVGPVKQ